jgi:hypothetical protein
MHFNVKLQKKIYWILMKFYLLQAITVFLLLTPLLQAQTQHKKIIISSTTTELKAKQEFDKIHKYVTAYPDIMSILKEKGVNFTSRPSGDYHIVVMEPFSDKEALAKVTKFLKKHYSDMYVNNYTPPATTQTLPTAVEPILTASKIEESETVENTETTQHVNTKEVSVSEVEAETIKEVVEKVEEAVKEETSKVVKEDSVESTITEKKSFILHKSAAKKEESHFTLPPWWVILSFLALIFAAIEGIIESNRRNKTAK